MVHFSQLGPLGLNKVITFEVLCRSWQIEPTVTLFRVFQTLCKQGDWFSFAKRRAPSHVCIDDNHSCMKHWNSRFFFIDRRVISDAMVWRHLDAAIDDPRPAAGSFNMVGVRRLSTHVVKLRDMLEVMGIYGFLCLPEWTSAEVQEEPHFDARSTLQRLPFYCTPPAAVDVFIPGPTLKDLAAGTPSSKILAKAEASQKRNASTSGATSGHVVNRTSSALPQLFGSTTRPNLFVGDSDDESDGDDDACVEISLVTPLCSAVVTPSSGNQGQSFAAPTAKGSNTRDSRGKGIMVNDVVVPSSGASRPRPASEPTPSFKDVFGGVVRNCEFTHEECDAPYRPTFRVLTKEGFKDHTVCKNIVDQFPTSGEMVHVESLSDDQLATKMIVLHCMMMSHSGELLARYRGLNQSHHEYVLSANSRLKCYGEKVASLTGLELQVSTLKKQVSGLNDKLATSDAFFAKSKAKGKERKKKIKSLTKSLDYLHSEVARLSAALNQVTILEAERDEEILRLKATRELLSLAASVGFERGLSMHRTKDEFVVVLKKIVNFMPGTYATEPLSVILHLEPEKLVHPANVPVPRGTRISSFIAKESTVTLVSESLELFANVNFTASSVASEHNEKMVNVEVDGSNPKMSDDTTASGHAFVQGISFALDDVTELVEVGSGRVPSGPDDVVVALSAHEKCDGLDSSFDVVEEAAVNPSGFRISFFSFFLLFLSPFSVRGGRVVWRRTLVAPSLGQIECRCVVIHPSDPESCHPP
uniref:Transposase (Putative), gypsy type n=1 Tax=Tanacetum cinerariifolium TaxID=118510 RepID=A0A6L2M6C7_TANCI|nr:hypothetical protein [Tanacetum cinerariifolium]